MWKKELTHNENPFDRWNEPSDSNAGSDSVLERCCFTDKSSLNFDQSVNQRIKLELNTNKCDLFLE